MKLSLLTAAIATLTSVAHAGTVSPSLFGFCSGTTTAPFVKVTGSIASRQVITIAATALPQKLVGGARIDVTYTGYKYIWGFKFTQSGSATIDVCSSNNCGNVQNYGTVIYSLPDASGATVSSFKGDFINGNGSRLVCIANTAEFRI